MNIRDAFNLAASHRKAGRPAKARVLCQQILEAKPDHGGALHMLGVMAHRAGDHDTAEGLLRRAIEAVPEAAPTHHVLGNVLKAQGDLDGAEAAYRQAIDLDPGRVAVLNNLGVLLEKRGRLAAAADCYRRAIETRPGFVKGLFNLGNVLAGQGKLADAVACYRRALARAPDNPDVHSNLGNTLKDQGDPEGAAACYRRALEIRPDDEAAHNNLGVALKDMGDTDGAIASYRRALDVNPDLAEAHENLGGALRQRGDHAGAAMAYRRVLELGPSPRVEVKLATLVPEINESIGQIFEIRKTLAARIKALEERQIVLADPYKEVGVTCFTLGYHGMNDRDLQTAVASFYLKACPSLAWRVPETDRAGRERPRIGFISRHFGEHAIGWCYRGIIEQLDRQRFEVVVLTIGGRADAASEAMRTAVEHSVALPDDLAKARAAIAAEALDVLVYTDIGMEPLTYFLGFARLAPVQCVLPGHPVTTGIPNIDYFVSSLGAEPDDADDHYSETLVRLPRLIYYAKPSPPVRRRSRESFGCDPDDHLYVCAHKLFKLHPDTDAVFAAILRRDAAGKLVLVEGKTPEQTEQLRQRLARAMPDVIDRVHWLPWLPLDDFLSLLIAADVVLDPLHFSGTNTSYQAFAFNKPVVTLPGEFLRGRTTYSLYRRHDVMDCVANDADDYVDIAVRLGTDPEWRQAVEARIAAVHGDLFEHPEAIEAFSGFLDDAIAKAITPKASDSAAPARRRPARRLARRG